MKKNIIINANVGIFRLSGQKIKACALKISGKARVGPSINRCKLSKARVAC